MTTLFTQRIMAGFGEVTFSILWDGDLASMPGWEQQSYTNTIHVPGGNVNETFLLGAGPITRTFTVLCENKTDFAVLFALQQASGTLRVPAAMNELVNVPEVNYFGDIYAEIPDVVLLGLAAARLWTDGAIQAAATFLRASLP